MKKLIILFFAVFAMTVQTSAQQKKVVRKQASTHITDKNDLNEEGVKVYYTPIGEEDNDEDQIFSVVEQKALFPGGEQAMKNFISQNMHYPPLAEENGIQGTVVYSVVVERDGSLSNVKVVKSIDPILDKEAYRLIKMMPKWIPARQNGKAVRMKFYLPIQFRLK